MASRFIEISYPPIHREAVRKKEKNCNTIIFKLNVSSYRRKKIIYRYADEDNLNISKSSVTVHTVAHRNKCVHLHNVIVEIPKKMYWRIRFTFTGLCGFILIIRVNIAITQIRMHILTTKGTINNTAFYTQRRYLRYVHIDFITNLGGFVMELNTTSRSTSENIRSNIWLQFISNAYKRNR